MSSTGGGISAQGSGMGSVGLPWDSGGVSGILCEGIEGTERGWELRDIRAKGNNP